MRIALGFLLSPLVGVLLPAFTLMLATSQRTELEAASFFFLLIPLSISYVSASIFGVPLFMLWRRQGWLRHWQIVVGSILCGMPFALFHFYEAAMIHAPIGLSMRWFSSVLVITAVTGIAFWAIAIKARA
jgi:hypothetical protein